VPNVVDIPESSDYAQVASLLHLDPAELGLAPASPGRAPSSGRRLGGRARVAIGAAVVAAVGLGTVLALKLTDTPAPFADMPINAWAPYWTASDAASSLQQHGSLLHEVSPFWFEVKGADAVEPAGNATLGQLAELADAIRATGGTVVPSVSDSSRTVSLNDMLSTTEQRRLHIDTLVQLAVDQQFDGLDIDYESFGFTVPRTQWSIASANWVAFVRELGLALHGRGLTLTVTIPPIYNTGTSGNAGYWVYKPHDIEPFVDHIRVMAYDFSTSTAGPIAPLEWVRTVVKAMKKAVDNDDKVVLGVGMYGRNWVMSTSGTCPADAEGTTTVTLRNVLDLATKRNATPVRDEVRQEASFTYDLDLGTCTQNRQVNFIDEQGVRARIDLARELRIGGVSLWALGFDSDTVWTGIADVARPQPKEATP
jgi:spore germination protein YaaH